jgi:hypothetical protein
MKMMMTGVCECTLLTSGECSNNVTWRDIILPSHVTVDLSMLNWHMTVIQISSLQDTSKKSFTFGRLVDSMSANCCHLSSLRNNDTKPSSVAVDTRVIT